MTPGRVKLTTFNTHYGVKPSRRPPAEPYDLEGALAAFDADLVVLQEVWRPDRERGRVDEAAAQLGYDLLYEPTGPASNDHRWPRITRNGTGESGIAVLSRLPMRRIGAPVLGPTPGDPAPRRTALDVEVDVDGRSLRVVAVPALLDWTRSEGALRAVAADLDGLTPGAGVTEALRRLAATMACHAAVKANDPLTREKMQYLLDELRRTAHSSVCPHGRPVVLRLTRREIEKNFDRV